MKVRIGSPGDHDGSEAARGQSPGGASVGSSACPAAHPAASSANELASKKLIWATIICSGFFVMELVAGLVAGSLAILSDSFHLLSDIAGFGISLTAIYLAQQPATTRHSWGFHRAEIIGAILSTFLIWILTGILVWEAIDRIQHPQPIDGRIMFFTALAGVAINIVLDVPKPMDEEQPLLPRKVKRKLHETNINVTSAAIHVIGDLISSIGVLISAGLIWFDPRMTIMDPICTFVFSFFVLLTTVKLMYNSLTVLMEGTPNDVDPVDVVRDLKNIEGVRDVHDLHIWNLTVGKAGIQKSIGMFHAAMAAHLDIHMRMPESDALVTIHDYNFILCQAQHLLCAKYGIHHCTLQIECMEDGLAVEDEDEDTDGNVESNDGYRGDTSDSSRDRASPDSIGSGRRRHCNHNRADHLMMAARPHCRPFMCRTQQESATN
ncbi:hypothetical protein HK102_001415 [Quaeritorhiza haematococci]|nr:hypothetical protein HK102_001415 [Quaeritorhiza haematococci]